MTTCCSTQCGCEGLSFIHKAVTEMYIWLYSVSSEIGKILGLGFGLIVFWVTSGCSQTEENYWVVTFKRPSWLNMCIPIHIENVMKEEAFILHLIPLFQCLNLHFSRK